MISDSDLELAKNIILTYRSDYPYYVMVSNYDLDSYNTGNRVTFYVYLAKDEIVSDSLYSFNVPADSLVIGVISSTPSNRYNDQRYTVSSFSGRLVVDDYQFIYSNASSNSYSVQPDLLATSDVTQPYFQGFAILLFIILLTVFLSNFFRR